MNFNALHLGAFFRCLSLVQTAGLIAATMYGAAALAVPVVFFGENQSPALRVVGSPKTAHDAFAGGLSGVGTENFTGETNGAAAPLSISFPGSSGNITATINGVGNILDIPASTSSAGRFNTTGAEAAPAGGKVWVSQGAFSISFDTAISAFGFYGTDIGDFNGQVTVTLKDTGGIDTLLVVNNTINGNDASLLFWGFIDSTKAYTAITFGNTSAGVDFFGFDDMIVGDLAQVIATIPAPGSMALIALGLLGLATVRRRHSCAAVGLGFSRRGRAS